MGYLAGFVAGQASIVAFLLWPIFRIARKVGYSRQRAWILVGSCAACSIAGSGANVLVAQQTWLPLSDIITGGGPMVVGLLHFILSPFTLSTIPILYFSFREWPSETRAREPGVFG